jgi:hypothetical protein
MITCGAVPALLPAYTGVSHHLAPRQATLPPGRAQYPGHGETRGRPVEPRVGPRDHGWPRRSRGLLSLAQIGL